MFNKMKNQESIVVHPGIYKFELPFYTMILPAQESDGTRQAIYCKVEIRVGDEFSDTGKIATILICGNESKGVWVTNDFEHIATSIRHGFFEQIFSGSADLLDDQQIKWVEVYTDKNRQNEIRLQWDPNRRRYLWN